MKRHRNSPDPEGEDPSPPTEAAPTQDLSPTAATTELAAILEACLADLEAGRPVDRAQLLARHPHLGSALEDAIAGLEFIHRTAPDPGPTPVRLGDFRILREVGRGGMGVVYEAEQVSLKRRVALKVLRHGPVADEVAMQRFQREAETVGHLHHTNIVPIFAIGADDGVRYYAMQFIEGSDLGRVAREMRGTGEDPDFRRIAEWGLQAADALAHAHQRGVIHRDIKPSNLILDPENRIWLTDFGLARRMDDVSLSLTGAILGTPRYMSPEQVAAARAPVDHRTDIYSLGATLYELVTGRPIFDAASSHEVLSQILHTEPAAPRTLAPRLPRDLETVILKCLAKDPTHRYSTAQALTEDLRAFAAGRPIAARRPRILERASRWVRRHRRLVTTSALSGAATLILAFGGAFAWRSYTASQLGSLQLDASGTGTLAEILDDQGRTLLPLFPVPNETPVRLAAGSYQIRLSAPGVLSETWPIEITAKQLAFHDVNLPSRWLWPPQEFGGPRAVEPVPLDDRAGFLVLIPPSNEAGQPVAPTRLRLLDGATAKPLWNQDLAFDASTLPGGDLHEWQSLLLHWAIAPNHAGTHIGERVTDLNRDGAGDFILVSRSSASLLAVSGASGHVLWWHRSRPAPPPHAPDDGRWTTRPGQSFVVSYPGIADLDDDGIADVVACFRSNGETYVGANGEAHQTAPESWIAAISGRTGGELWRRPVQAPWSDYVSSSSGAKFETLAHPAVLTLHGRPAVVLPVEDRLHLWEGRTGVPLEHAPRLGFDLEQAPNYFPLQGRTNTHALVRRRFVQTDAHLELLAVDLESGSIRWRTTPLTVLGGVGQELDSMPPESFTATDLEDDSRTEIVCLTSRHPSPNRWTFGIQVLDATTGQPRWETHLHDGDHPQSIPSGARFLPGPDLDRDGSRDLFAVLPSYDRTSKRHGLLAVALSGSDGSIIWRRHHPGIPGATSLAWWHDGADGWPLLVATTSQFSGGRSSTFIFNSGSGRIAHTLLDVQEVKLLDIDGDGAADLLHPLHTQSALRWAAVRGQPAPTWQRLGEWVAGPDADGDKVPDAYALSGRALGARSGLDGRSLWKTEADFAFPETLWNAWADPSRPPPSAGSEPGILVATVSLWRTSGPNARQSYRSLAAFSPKDGRKVWTAAGLDFGGGSQSGMSLGWAYDYPQVDLTDLDGDGAPEVLASSIADSNQPWLSVVSGRDGRVLWETPIVEGAMAPDPRPAGPPIADFNGDGILDLALVIPPAEAGTDTSASTYRVAILDGRDGHSLWPAPFDLARDPRHVVWPEPTLGDLDGDTLPEVLVVRHQGYSENQGYGCELVVLDGRSGQVRWTWTWNAGFPTIWPPLVLTSPEPAGRRVALGITKLGVGGFTLVVLDHEGNPVVRREIGLIGHPPDRGGLGWSALDLDGDGTSELVYPNWGFLCAGFGPGLIERWRVPLAGRGGDGFRLVPDSMPRTDFVGGATMILWTGRDVFGIQGSRGEIVWRGHAPAAPLWGNSGGHLLRPVSLGPESDRPGLQFTQPLAPGGRSSVETTWPTTPDGRYRAQQR